MACSNCGKPLAEHCGIHLIPCCPGKCLTFADKIRIAKEAREAGKQMRRG